MKAFYPAMLAAVFLAGCDNKPTQAQAPDCADPAIVQSLQSSLQTAFFKNVQAWGTHEYSAVVDPNAIVALWPQFVVKMNSVVADAPDPRQKSQTRACHAAITVELPSPVLTAASAQSKLVYGAVDYQQQILQRANAGQVSMTGNQFSQNITYHVSQDANQTPVVTQFDSANWNSLAQTIATAILPYGVKNEITLNGVRMTKEKALEAVSGATPTATTSLAKPAKSVAQTGDANDDGLSSPSEIEALPAQDLSRERAENTRANQTIGRVWNTMDDTVRQSLVAEQRNWVRDKESTCGAKNSESARLNCDTRLTRQRIDYLRGFALPDQ